MFRAVETVFAHPPVAAIEGPEQMRAYLIDPRRRKQIHVGELRTIRIALNSLIDTKSIA